LDALAVVVVVVAVGSGIATPSGVAAGITVVLLARVVSIATTVRHALAVVLALYVAAVARHAVAVSLAARAVLTHLAGLCGSIAAGKGLQTVQKGI